MELEIRQVTKSYGQKLALKQVSLKLGPGITGLLGPNGAGKSTLMRMISTLESPTKGSLLWNGEDIAQHPERIREVLGYLPQDFGVYPNLNPVEFLEYMAAIKGLSMKHAKRRIQELLEILNLSQDRKRLLGGFSGGMKQRVGIAQSLLNDPEILIVDEPTVGLDPEERIRFRNLLSTLAESRVIILSTHIVTDIESAAPRIALLAKGEVVKFGTPEELMSSVEHKVWNCVVPTSALQQLQEKYMISSTIHRPDGVHARVVSNRRPDFLATPLSPTLEDAYLYAVGDGGGEE
ncbi:ABC transporter ATP-binding protein [Paenibacillus sp. CAA11]|uniref:ABC transporter ATP-binding protein n=1 Tax=Paenibacillus sp. CAA11 TaxID=1532905 RepID=UPI000D34936D|nr:ABC transporter ATP-binding protein [Paenibacillus sp. CAA11]AWB43511.1 ABC transporter ATP-binding protein [Paenibacillus sp. CAA11]